MNIHSNTVLRTTRRMEWLDISRVFCMLIIIYMHFPWEGGMDKMPADLFMCGAVPFCFFWAGCFCARSPQWNHLWEMALQFCTVMVALLIFLVSYQSFSFAPEPENTLSIGSIAIYAIGCYSHSYQIAEKNQNLPLKYVALFLIGVGILSILVACKNNNLNGISWLFMPWRPTIFGLLTGVSLFTLLSYFEQGVPTHHTLSCI